MSCCIYLTLVQKLQKDKMDVLELLEIIAKNEESQHQFKTNVTKR